MSELNNGSNNSDLEHNPQEGVSRVNNRIKLNNQKLEADRHELRKKVLPMLFRLIIVFLSFDALILLGVSFSIINLDNSVIITLLTTTTAIVLGLFAIAMRWLFADRR